MAEPEFSKELVVRCAKAIGRIYHPNDDYEFGDFNEDVRAVLRESGHAELVEALKEIEFHGGPSADYARAALKKAGRYDQTTLQELNRLQIEIVDTHGLLLEAVKFVPKNTDIYGRIQRALREGPLQAQIEKNGWWDG